MPYWETEFPHLGSWTKSSERSDQYNCAAFAAGDQSQKWDPFPPGLHYWPVNFARSYASDVWVRVYATIGYSVCADGELEDSYEKIVIYTNAYGGVEHVARQLPDGRWTSKIGDEEDIIHESPQSLSVGYGQPTIFMRRRLGSAIQAVSAT
jgi:hypothetical protein